MSLGRSIGSNPLKQVKEYDLYTDIVIGAFLACRNGRAYRRLINTCPASARSDRVHI